MDTVQTSEENVAVHGQLDEKICRLCCLEDQQELSLIFPDGSSDESNKLLLKKIFECTTVQIINEGDDQNASICRGCVDKIDDFFTYREQCRENDDRIRQRSHNSPQIRIKQEKDLHLDISINEPNLACEDEFLLEESSQPRPASYSTTTVNEFQPGSENEPINKDGEDSLLQPMSSRSNNTPSQLNHTTDEITIKRETIVDDDDVYYNSDGEVADVSASAKSHYQPESAESQVGVPGSSGQKAQYRIVMNANNRERLVYQGYLYCRHFSRRDGSIHWRCRLGGCQAAVNLHLDGTITHANGNAHCHAQNGLDEDLGRSGPDEEVAVVDVDASCEQFGEEDISQEEMNDSEPVAVSADSLQIVPNKKKGETLVHLGFKYCKRYLKMDGSTFWKCRSNNNKCSAGVYVYPDSRVKYHGIHNHEKVVDGQEAELDNSMEDEVDQPYMIIEDVEDDDDQEEETEGYTDDMATLLTNSLEVMMPGDQKQVKKNYEITTNVKGRECLIYEGHQYSKDRERVDGAVFWRCRRNYDKCRAMAIVYRNGKVEKCGEHFHETDKRYLERQELGNGSKMYRITKNQRGNDALVFEGHRFSKEWSRVNGSIIWRCSYKSGICKMKVVLNADGFVHHMGSDHEHDHEKTEAPVTEEFVTDDVVEVTDDSLITPVRSQPKLVSQPALPTCPTFTPEQQAAGGYRIVKNRKGFEALVHDGYRYCKVRVRQDGSVKWLCKMNKKTCRAAVDLFPDGTVTKASEYDHNHERPTDMDTMEEEEDVDSSGFETTYPIDPEVFGNSQWYYVKNSKNGISMIHAGYRYTKKCDRVDGTSLWRCSASQRGCKAGVILFPNDTLAMVENAEHSHKPYESVKPTETESDGTETKKSDVIDISEPDETVDDSQITMHSLLQTVLGGDEVPWMGGETESEPASESVWFNSSTDRPYPRPTGPPNFRIIKNRRKTDSLVHRGYRYCKIRDRQDGSILWSCQMNKKTCKASVNLTTDGRVEVINGKHNHQQTDVDDIEEAPAVETVVDSGSDVELTVEEPAKPKPTSQPDKHPDYYYSMNKSNRECLIHKGYRFCKRNDRPDGSTVWRCSMGGNTCMVVVTIQADGTPEQNSIVHNHRPLDDLPPEIERAAKPTAAASVGSETNEVTVYNRQGDMLEWKGFHYRKIKELPDSCIIWICKVDSCRVAVKMLPNNQLKMLSESEHNHTAPGQLSSSSASAAPSKSTSNVSSPGTKQRSYRLFKNQRGQMTLLYKGFRYSIRNRNQDGSSTWKCRANASCRVIIHLMPDDRIVPGSGQVDHNHEPNWETPKSLDSAAQTRVNPLYDYLNIIPGSSSQPSQPQEAVPQKEDQTDTSQNAQSSPDSNSFGRNVIEHKGYYYRLVVRKKNGREYWRCVHFKNRACRAALFCRDNGAIVTSSNGKEHSHSGGANGKPLPSMAGSSNGYKVKADSSGLPLARSQAQPSPPEEVSLARGDEERYIDHGDYVIAKNRKDQNTLIFKDRRYYLSYNRSDGSAVWRCAHRKRYKCYAYVRLRPDGRLLSTGEHEHSHSLNNSEQTSTPEAKETKNYKIVKNRVGNDILIHDSHRFRLNYQRNDGTTHWRCVWARSNHCSAGVYLMNNGVLKNAANEAQIIHNHPPPGQVKKAVAGKVDSQLNEGQQTSSQSKSETDEQSRTIPEAEGITDYKFIEEGSNKILVCRGYRYWYTWIRKDGSIYYRCAEVKRLQCPMGTLLLSNGKLIRANEHPHNHNPTQLEPEEDFLGFPTEAKAVDVPQQEEKVVYYPPLPIPPDGDADYKIVKTSRGESLIYKGYRYWAKNRLANGIVSLCCTRKKMKKCPAMLRLLTNGRIIDPIGAGHTHPPNIEGGSATDTSMQLTPLSIAPVLPKPTVVKEPAKPKESQQSVAPKLPPLSFNEESEDDAEQGDESLIGSRRYVFMKSTSQRNFIVFEGFVYDFEHKQHDGCVFYRCKTNEACSASLMLLTNGRVMNLDDSLHIHEKPDLTNLRPVGRGSKEFKIVQNKNGSNILVHRGHRYTTPRAKTDGAGIWYCHTYVPTLNRRCYVPIELLPNGRVAPVSEKQHQHTAPFKTKQETQAAPVDDPKDNISPVKSEPSSEPEGKSDNRMLLLGGHRYNYAHKRDDDAILWKCAKSSCNASMYRLTDGQIVKGPDHNHEKMDTSDSAKSHKRKYVEVETKPNSSSPINPGDDSVATRTSKVDTFKKNPYIGKSITHEGYRYVYYLTRRDGSEHWRCCRRIPLKCRGGLFKQVDGTLSHSNDEGHTHPPETTDYEDTLPVTYTAPDETSQDSIDSAEHEESVTEPASYLDDEGSYDYELVDVKGKKRGFYLIHKGAMFVTGHTRRDRARYYRCRTVGCRVAMLLHRNGLLVRTNEHTHDCQNAVKTDEVERTDVEEHMDEQSEENSAKKLRLDESDVEEESMLETADVEPLDAPITNGSESAEVVVVEVKEEPVDAL
ncbi:uncharacterized protein LOC131440455 [Malaya genurostris]|uniref:uncharacterized protein LOC131440455 n=1 Tax=Malaya genurostris TaxID=325434 RepID=UPI0026F3A396|nr:uncharacterized protein LOC131440455 [Malaya genurostris]